MKKVIIFAAMILVASGVIFSWGSIRRVAAQVIDYFYADPDMGPFENIKQGMTKEEFMLKRAEQIAMFRGLKSDVPVDPNLRINAIKQLERQEEARAKIPEGQMAPMDLPWTEIGPNPIPNAQVTVAPVTTASGRTISIAVHPTNPDLVYVGTAQGGLYRSTNGGTNWTRMLDNALSLAINSIEIAPSQPDTIFVGTGESGFSADSFFGVGIYRIDNASSGSPLVSGPFGSTLFTGRSVSAIAIHPTDPNTIFVTSASGVGGIGGVANNTLPARGIFRSTDALSAAPTFTKLTVTGPAAQDRAFNDVVMDPANPNLVLATLADSFALNEGGVFRTTKALAATPTITRTFVAGNGTTNSRTELALHSSGGVVTVFAASGTAGGTVQRSTDGGATWAQRIDNNFCTAQCFYDIAVDVDPTNPNTVYLGGSPNLIFGRSTNGGTSFTANAATAGGLHADSHAIAVAPSLPSTIYFGSDGGIYKSTDNGTTWASLNNNQFTATQFMSIDVHPTDPNFSIGGTQDNGTNWYQPAGTWTRADFGDGGFAVIDQNALDTTNVTVYHTYFNQTNAMGFGRSLSTATMQDNLWTGLGCGFVGFVANGMTCAASAILFYAPMERGPGNPNTLYFGSDVLYRSANSGTTMTKVSQEPIQSGVPISAIGIAPSNDNVRVVGQSNGNIFGTTTGANPLVNMDPANAVPNNYIGRVAIHPTNPDIAYVTLVAFGVANVWRTSTLSSSPMAPTWTAATGTGANVLPQVPVNAFLIDPANPNLIYAGTDIGVYVSGDQGTNWFPFGTGLPRVAVFDMAMAPGQVVRIATHGRGMWQIPAINPTAANVPISGRVVTAKGEGIRNARVILTAQNGTVRTAVTNSFGVYRFLDVPAGASYVINANAKGYSFTPQSFVLNDELAEFDLVASP